MLETGVVLSEFPPGTPTLPHRFPIRNRIITGMAKATVIVEAHAKGGSLVSARWALDQGRVPLAGHVLLVSGRISYEIAQKALVARIPVVAAVSAPSSLAVALAERSGMALVGFLRGTSLNVYGRCERILR